MVTPHNGVTPDPDNETQNEAVACAYCHHIEDIKHGVAMNKNLVSLREKVYIIAKSNPGKWNDPKKIVKMYQFLFQCQSSFNFI